MKINKIAAAALALSLAFTAASAVAQAAMVNGEVKKIDESAGKITLKHGPIKNLDMDEDGMTMIFRVQDPERVHRRPLRAQHKHSPPALPGGGRQRH